MASDTIAFQFGHHLHADRAHHLVCFAIQETVVDTTTTRIIIIGEC